jgi:Ohr subfamily peroxiredoxin
MKILYTAEVTVQGGREGHACTSDGTLDLKLSTPKALGGSGEAGTNPEQLFAAGYAACFQSALMLVARRQRVDASQSVVTAKVGIGSNGEGGFGLEVELHVSIPGLDKAASEQLVAQAHQICPYSNATRGNIPVTLTVG